MLVVDCSVAFESIALGWSVALVTQGLDSLELVVIALGQEPELIQDCSGKPVAVGWSVLVTQGLDSARWSLVVEQGDSLCIDFLWMYVSIGVHSKQPHSCLSIAKRFEDFLLHLLHCLLNINKHNVVKNIQFWFRYKFLISTYWLVANSNSFIPINSSVSRLYYRGITGSSTSG